MDHNFLTVSLVLHAFDYAATFNMCFEESQDNTINPLNPFSRRARKPDEILDIDYLDVKNHWAPLMVQGHQHSTHAHVVLTFTEFVYNGCQRNVQHDHVFTTLEDYGDTPQFSIGNNG